MALVPDVLSALFSLRPTSFLNFRVLTLADASVEVWLPLRIGRLRFSVRGRLGPSVAAHSRGAGVPPYLLEVGLSGRSCTSVLLVLLWSLGIKLTMMVPGDPGSVSVFILFVSSCLSLFGACLTCIADPAAILVHAKGPRGRLFWCTPS